MHNGYILRKDFYQSAISSNSEKIYSFDDSITEFNPFSNNKILLNFKNTIGQYFGVFNIENETLEKLEPFPFKEVKFMM